MMPVPGASGQPSRTLVIAAAAVPLTGWTVHAVSLHRKLAAARRDPLTGLYGRDGYTVRATALTASHPKAVMVLTCDVDHFKQINENYSHAAGDRVLAATADRLSTWAGSRGVEGLGGLP